MSLVSDCIGGHARQSTPIVELKSTVTCEPTYGFLPCTTEIWGQLFLIVVYEYLLSLGDQYVAAGSELFFKIIGPGIFGASLFQVLGTIPVVVLMLVSGLSASYESVAEQAAMGMSMLAGAAVMQLTLVWGSCVAFGSFDISKTSTSSNTEQKKPFSLTGLGVKTDADTSKTAKVMMISMVPFLILQLPKILNSSSGTRVTVLVTLIVTLAFLFVYCFYQVFQPWIQNRKFEYLMRKYVKDKLLKLLSSHGNPNVALIKEIFHEIDKNNNAYISTAELRVLILGIQLQNKVGLNTDNTLEKVMEAFDSSGDARIEEAEFVKGISKYISDAKQSLDTENHNHFKLPSKTSKNTGEEGQGLVAQKEDTTPSASISWWTYFQAAFQLLFGTAILLLLAQPLIETVSDFSTSANISSFYVSYVVIPLAMNYRMAMGTIKSARQKTQKAISLTLSEIYGGVFMNNMMGLAMFLALVYIRDLSWDVSAEVLVVLVICTLMGVFASFCTKFPLWTSFVAYLLYPISLLLLYVLVTVLGWS
ncbi:sodium/calcium exchanger NCL2-like [Cornus florida]|uniref:sodium/calcium exchanger NCL2-like n=1 Tax=Cornus florida TaxID=4283 RepID=UPI00289934F0|nr:sodium/calcium exchanger NCL2-like [Cornus florida]